MDIRKLSIILASLCLALTSLSAQTEIRRYAITDETDFGIVYRLPKTEIELVLTIKETEYKKGQYQAWAKKYLTQTPKGEDEKSFSIDNVRCELIGVPDSDKQYLVVFDKHSIAPCLYLAEGNLISSVNAKNQMEAKLRPAKKQDKEFDEQLPALPRDYAVATTEAKRAEIVANYIYELRETMNDIMLGRAEQMPSDGEAMRLVLERLKKEEARSKKLFLGDTAVRYKELRFHIIPKREGISQDTLCRFSSQWGVVDKDDLTGDVLSLSLDVLEDHAPLSIEEQEKLEKKEGLIFNLPGTGLLRLELNGQKLLEERLSLTQMGTIQSLNKKMFNLKDDAVTAVYFNLQTGAIEKIVNN